MEPVRFVMTAVRIFLTLGLVFGYTEIVRDIAKAAVHAHTHKRFSAAKYNRLLWSKDTKNSQPVDPRKGDQK